MAGDRLERRALRILGALSGKGEATLRPGGASVMILHLDGARTLRCPAEVIEAMFARGWIATRADATEDRRIIVTEDGRSWRHRALAGGGYAAQHRSIGTMSLPGGASATGNLAESPLSRLARPRRAGDPAWLNAAQLSAGERLRSDFEFGQLGQRVTASWDPARTVRDDGGVAAPDLPDRALDARARFNAALEAVGPELSGLLVDICCLLKGLEKVESERGWPRRSAKVVLRTALSALDRHYNPPANRTSRSLRHWGAAGYRPSLAP